MFQHTKRLGHLALELLFPSSCLGCGQRGELLCRECQSALPWIEPPLCERCGWPLLGEASCRQCRGWTELDGLRSPFRFEGLIRQAVHSLKYENLKAVARPLAGILADYVWENPMPAGLLVAVPLHSRRLRERGYNQSGLVAAELGRLLDLPVAEGVVVRHRHTPAQAEADSAERRRHNVARAFAARGEGLQGKGVLLVDDVCTTGATLESCAAALKAGGAASVWALTIAREV